MFKNLLKKSFGRKSSEKKNTPSQNLALSLRKQSKDLSSLIITKTKEVEAEFFSIKHKLKNLRETNYNLGLMHIEKGNLPTAIFRFRFIKKFWPDFFEAYYQLAYCLVLHKQPYKAMNVLQELLTKNPNYDESHQQKAQEMLDYIKNALNQASINATNS